MSLLNNEDLRNFFSGRRRFHLAWFFSILLIIRVTRYPTLPGILICLLGASLRFYSSGFLRKESKLAVGGPYQFTRNPLYLGTFIMVIGFTISVKMYFLTLVMGFIFFLNYHYVIENEERKLPDVFGEAYIQYCSLVPRFLPRLSAPSREELMKINSTPEAYAFSFPLAKKNKAFEAYISFVALFIGAALLVLLKKTLLKML